MINDFGAGVILGFVFTISIVGFVINHRGELKDCAKQHNVYACEIVYQPMKESE